MTPLDILIIAAIREGRQTTKCQKCQDEARKWHFNPNTAWRKVDNRQQALRRRGIIRFAPGPDGKKRWEVVE
jgi:hypothetical protein